MTTTAQPALLYADGTRTLACDGAVLEISNVVTGRSLMVSVLADHLSTGPVPAIVADHLRQSGAEPSAWIAILSGGNPWAVVPVDCLSAVEQAIAMGRVERSRRAVAQAARVRAEREWDALNNDGGDGYNPHRIRREWIGREPTVKGEYEEDPR